jgi:phosphate:Na+ symporter
MSTMALLRRLTLPTIIGILAWGFWMDDDFLRLSAGVALFMFGMLSLEQGFQAFTGGVLERVLESSTRTRIRSMGFGLVATALMQSSSLVTLITITFLSAGLIGLAAGIGIIFGSNIGTTTGAWLMAYYGVKIDLAAYALPMVVFGILLIYQKTPKLKGCGNVLLGIAFLFIGIQFIKEGFEAVSQGMDLARFSVEGLPGVLIFVGIGTLATVVMQSSHAVLMLTIAALATQQVTYFNALALAIGANVGTTITAVLGAMSANVAGKRLAGAHLVFNLTTGLIAIAFIAPMATLVDDLSGWLGIAEDDYTLKLAVFHTVFNVLGVVIMLPLVDRLVALLEQVLPERLIVDGVEQPRFLVDSLVDYPDAALIALTSETQHLGINALEIMADAIGLKPQDLLGDEPVEALVARSRKIEHVRLKHLYQTRMKAIYSAILEFSSKAQPNLSGPDAEKMDELRRASHALVEAIKTLRMVRKNMARYIRSDNAYMRDHYDRMRIHLGQLIRSVIELRSARDVEEIRRRLEALDAEVAADDAVANGTLDRLIRDNLIDAEMASSLMNDTAYASTIHHNLAKAAGIIAGLVREYSEDVAELPEEETETAAGQRQRVARLMWESQRDIDRAVEEMRQSR